MGKDWRESMVKFKFTVNKPQGLDEASAGRLVKEAIGCKGNVMIRKGEKNGNAKLIFHVLSMLVKAGEEVEIMVEGEGEREEAASLEEFVKNNM